MSSVFRIIKYYNDVLEEITFVAGEINTRNYLESCNKHNADKNVFYFAHKIIIEE